MDPTASWQTIRQEAERAEVTMPSIVKSASACGFAAAHQMALVFKWEALHMLNTQQPSLLQQFVNHGGVLFKIYVIGMQVRCNRLFIGGS